MGSEARARLGLAGVLLVTLLSFNQLFGRGNYVGPVLLGILLAVGFVMIFRRLGLGALITLAASGAGLVWYVTFLFAAERTFFGFPTPTAIAAVGRAAGRAYGFSQIDYAPVPVRPGYVILLVAGMWMAATFAELAAFRWKRPLLAVLPGVALFSVTMIVGTGRGAPLLVPLFLVALLLFWGFESSHRIRSWGRWVGAWSADRAPEPDAVTGSLARRMGAACVAAALVAPIFLPALGDGLLAWRNEVGGGLGTEGKGGGRIDPLVSIAPSLVNQSDLVLFRVRSERRSYWRLVALPHYDGETWSPPTEDEELTPASGILDGFDDDPWIPVKRARDRVEQEIRIVGLQGRHLPGAVQPVEVDMLGSGREEDLRVHPLTGDLRLEGELRSELSYRVESVAPSPTFRELQHARPGRIDPVFTTRPDLDPRVENLRDRWIEGYTTPYEQLVAIQDAFRSGDYTYSIPAPDQIARDQETSADLLTRFLLDTRTGYCQQFAAAFAALSRSLGYPTRVVVGFLPGQPEGGDTYVVRGTDAHAWPEVYFEDYGWVRFEPTPRIDRPPIVPEYTFVPASGGVLGNDGGVGRGGAGEGEGASDARRLNEPGVGGSIARQENRPAGAPASPATQEEDIRWERTFRNLALVLVALAVLCLGAVPALKARRVRRLYRDARDPRSVAAAAFLEFMYEAGELAAPRGPAESARAYARRIARMKELSESSTLQLASLHDRAVYSAPGGEVDEREARSIVRDLRAALWHKASWWERGMRLFSPRSLVRPG
jgi:transglutaminase-like putative cysteine protease